MILKASQRGSGSRLAAHLLNVRDNDHVEVHELRGFTSDDLTGAFQETDAIAKGTRCKQYLFSLSFSPPETANVPVTDFEDAIARAEERLGLSGQARAIVFHEKNGRRHAHAVWSRIDVERMKAINMPFFKTRLKGLSRELFLDHGWRLPDGFRDKRNRDPRNFTLAEWQQAKRQGKDAREIKQTFQEAWSVSDTKEAFANALEEKGYVLARGDRRGFVAVDIHGEVYAIPKMTGLKTKEVREKLGDPKELRSVDQAKEHIAKTMQPVLSRWDEELKHQQQEMKSRQVQQRKKLVERQQAERAALKKNLKERQIREAKQRQAKFRTGLKGLWDRLRGEHRRTRKENERDALLAHRRDQKQTDDLIFRQLDGRRNLKRHHDQERGHFQSRDRDLALDKERFDELHDLGRKEVRDGPSLER